MDRLTVGLLPEMENSWKDEEMVGFLDGCWVVKIVAVSFCFVIIS